MKLITIEYQGRQHFECVPHFGGANRLRYTQLNDQIKRDFCNETGISLLAIRYDQNPIEILKNTIDI